jgi:hypothetical protein
MTFETLVRHLRVLWRAESIIADVHIRQFGKSSAFAALSVLLVVMALGMLSLA